MHLPAFLSIRSTPGHHKFLYCSNSKFATVFPPINTPLHRHVFGIIRMYEQVYEIIHPNLPPKLRLRSLPYATLYTCVCVVICRDMRHELFLGPTMYAFLHPCIVNLSVDIQLVQSPPILPLHH